MYTHSDCDLFWDARMHSGAFLVSLEHTSTQPFSNVIYNNNNSWMSLSAVASRRTGLNAQSVYGLSHEHSSQHIDFIYLFDSAHEFMYCCNALRFMSLEYERPYTLLSAN